MLLLWLYVAAALLQAVVGWRVGQASSAHRQVVLGWSPLAVWLWFLSCGFLLLVYYPLPSSPHHLDKLLFTIGGVLVWSLWCALHPRGLARVLNSRPYGWMKVALANLLLFIVLGEGVLRLADPVLARAGLFERKFNSGWLKPHRATEGSIEHTNSNGFRDRERTVEKPASSVRVVALGDSFTWGTGVTYDETIVTVLERTLNEMQPQFEIINLGVPGFEPEHELDMLRQFGIQFQPDVVMLNFFIGNDIMRKRGAGREVPFIVAGNSYYVHSNGNWVHDHGGMDRWYLYHHLNYLIRVDFAPLRRLFQRREGAPKNVTPAGTSSLPAGWYVDYVKYLTQRSDIFDKTDTVEWSYHWRHTTEVLDTLVEFLQARQIPFLIVLIPEKVQLDQDLQHEFLIAVRASPGKYDFDKPQRQLNRWCAGHGVVCVDLLSMWKQTPEATRLYFENDPHWTPEGHARAALATLPILYQALIPKIASREEDGKRSSPPIHK